MCPAASQPKRPVNARALLAANVVALRRSKELSQEALAFEAGLHRTFVGNIERGLKNTTILTLLMISQSLGVTVSELLRGLEKRIAELRKPSTKRPAESHASRTVERS